MTRSTGSDQPGTGVVGGVDTHLDTHTAVVLDAQGRFLAAAVFTADLPGYRRLLGWLRQHGPVSRVGVEGTGSYGAGLTRYLTSQGVEVLEVERPNRARRRRVGKSDPIDAENAARTALAGVGVGAPKDTTGAVEALRNLRVARRAAVRHRADCQRRIKTLLVTAPEELRARLRGCTTRQLIDRCGLLRPDPARVAEPAHAIKVALRQLAREHQRLSDDITELDQLIEPLVATVNAPLLALPGVGPDVAGTLLVTAGANPDRMHSEAAFARLCGVAPIPASSGRTDRHRLNRGGDRQANAALYRIAISRLRWDPATQAYMERRRAEGLTKTEVIRCLKRHIARQIHRTLVQAPNTTHQTSHAA